MTITQEVLLFFVGIAVGYINVMAGGGSLLSLPIMVLMGMPAPVANGTNRIAILAQSIMSTWVFIRKGVSELKLSLSLSLAALPGAWVGAYYGLKLQGVWFNRFLAVVMIVVMILMATEKRLVKVETTQQAQRLWLTHGLMVVVGFYGGLIHVGIGFLIMAVLHRVAGMDLLRVNAHKVLLIVPFTILSLIIFAIHTDIAWRAGLVLALGTGTGGWLGAHMMIQKGERLIKLVFNLALVMLIVKLLFFS